MGLAGGAGFPASGAGATSVLGLGAFFSPLLTTFVDFFASFVTVPAFTSVFGALTSGLAGGAGFPASGAGATSVLGLGTFFPPLSTTFVDFFASFVTVPAFTSVFGALTSGLAGGAGFLASGAGATLLSGVASSAAAATAPAFTQSFSPM